MFIHRITNKIIFKKFINKKLSTCIQNKSVCKNTEYVSNATDKSCFNCPNKMLQTRLNYGLALFAIGGIVEIYTYDKSNDISKSTGLGFGLLAACLVIL